MYIVGLTGGIGSGKSVVADRFEELGIEVIDADQISRKVVEPGMPALESIKEYFGEDILEGNALNRGKMRDIIFFDIKKRKWLESLLHPLINKLIKESLENTSSDYSILVSPLLLETNQFEICSRILVIDAEESDQINRTIQRDGVSKDQVSKIIESQITRKERLAKADDVLLNDKSLDVLYLKIDDLNHKYLKLCQR